MPPQKPLFVSDENQTFFHRSPLRRSQSRIPRHTPQLRQGRSGSKLANTRNSPTTHGFPWPCQSLPTTHFRLCKNRCTTYRPHSRCQSRTTNRFRTSTERSLQESTSSSIAMKQMGRRTTESLRDTEVPTLRRTLTTCTPVRRTPL